MRKPGRRHRATPVGARVRVRVRARFRDGTLPFV